MALRVKVEREDFDLVFSNGWVDGLVQGRRGLWVYVELGTEQEYIKRPSDDPRTEYRLFRGCDVFFAESREQLEALTDNTNAELVNQTVILYC